MAFDAAGDLFLGNESGGGIVGDTAATLTTSAPDGVALNLTGRPPTNIERLVEDGKGDLPAGLTSLGDPNVGSALSLPAGDYMYGNININNGGSITGTGGLVWIWLQHGVNPNGNVTAAADIGRRHLPLTRFAGGLGACR